MCMYPRLMSFVRRKRNQLVRLQKILSRQVVSLGFVWGLREQLYSNPETLDRMKRVSPEGFYLLGIALRSDAIIRVCALTQGGFHVPDKTLTFQRVIDLTIEVFGRQLTPDPHSLGLFQRCSGGDEYGNARIAEREFSEILHRVYRDIAPVRKFRNKRLAHVDLSTAQKHPGVVPGPPDTLLSSLVNDIYRANDLLCDYLIGAGLARPSLTSPAELDWALQDSIRYRMFRDLANADTDAAELVKRFRMRVDR